MNTAAIPPLDLRELVTSLRDDAVEVVRCPCGAARLARLYHARHWWELTDHDGFNQLHAGCPRPMTYEEIRRSA